MYLFLYLCVLLPLFGFIGLLFWGSLPKDSKKQLHSSPNVLIKKWAILIAVFLLPLIGILYKINFPISVTPAIAPSHSVSSSNASSAVTSSIKPIESSSIPFVSSKPAEPIESDIPSYSSSSNSSSEPADSEISSANSESSNPIVAPPHSESVASSEISSSSTEPLEEVITENTRTVYRTKNGEKYHYVNPCGRGNYFACTLDSALTIGLEPCKKCVN